LEFLFYRKPLHSQHLHQLATQYHNQLTVKNQLLSAAHKILQSQHLYQLATQYHNQLTVKNQLLSATHTNGFQLHKI